MGCLQIFCRCGIEQVHIIFLYDGTISPLDEDGILESVASTGRVVIVDESAARCGFGHDVAALIAQKGFHYLKAPIELVTPPHSPSNSQPFKNHVTKFTLY
jgi:pyruvate/2-oxoglutarate/acetoin dehydrogenase E1 component